MSHVEFGGVGGEGEHRGEGRQSGELHHLDLTGTRGGGRNAGVG